MTTKETARQDRTRLLDVPEHRMTARFEVRASGDDVKLTGYASTFEPYEMHGGPAMGGWIEQLDRNAFNKTLREKPDLMLLINHEGMPLARTQSGTLTLSVDDGGLKVEAKLDRSDPDVQRLEPKMRRGDMNEMSFAFRVKKQRWDYAPDFDDDPFGLRTIEEVSLHKGDVSIVNFGANPTTSAELRRRKNGAPMRRGRSLLEAERQMAADERKRHRSSRTAGPSGSAARAARRVAGDAVEHRARNIIGDALVQRAREILAELEYSPAAKARRSSRATTLLPPAGRSYFRDLAQGGEPTSLVRLTSLIQEAATRPR